MLNVKIVTNGKNNEIIGEMADGSLKIRIKAPPVDGKANNMLLDYLAGYLKVPRKMISIVKGDHTSKKTIEICGLTEEEIIKRLYINQHK